MFLLLKGHSPAVAQQCLPASRLRFQRFSEQALCPEPHLQIPGPTWMVKICQYVEDPTVYICLPSRKYHHRLGFGWFSAQGLPLTTVSCTLLSHLPSQLQSDESKRGPSGLMDSFLMTQSQFHSRNTVKVRFLLKFSVLRVEIRINPPFSPGPHGPHGPHGPQGPQGP